MREPLPPPLFGDRASELSPGVQLRLLDTRGLTGSQESEAAVVHVVKGWRCVLRFAVEVANREREVGEELLSDLVIWWNARSI